MKRNDQIDPLYYVSMHVSIIHSHCVNVRICKMYIHVARKVPGTGAHEKVLTSEPRKGFGAAGETCAAVKPTTELSEEDRSLRTAFLNAALRM